MWEATSGRRYKTEKIHHEEHEGHEAGGEFLPSSFMICVYQCDQWAMLELSAFA
jgi:hypothetical protein